MNGHIKKVGETVFFETVLTYMGKHLSHRWKVSIPHWMVFDDCLANVNLRNMEVTVYRHNDIKIGKLLFNTLTRKEV
jgi:hypothetical protein